MYTFVKQIGENIEKLYLYCFSYKIMRNILTLHASGLSALLLYAVGRSKQIHHLSGDMVTEALPHSDIATQ